MSGLNSGMIRSILVSVRFSQKMAFLDGRRNGVQKFEWKLFQYIGRRDDDPSTEHSFLTVL